MAFIIIVGTVEKESNGLFGRDEPVEAGTKRMAGRFRPHQRMLVVSERYCTAVIPHLVEVGVEWNVVISVIPENIHFFGTVVQIETTTRSKIMRGKSNACLCRAIHT